MIAAAAAGADVVDVAIDSKYLDLPYLQGLTCTLLGMSGLTSQPPMGAVTLALEQTGLGTGIRYADIQALNLYWTQVRMLYTCFEANVRASDSSVFAHEMPGGQYTNLMVCSPQIAFSTISFDCSGRISSKHLNLVLVPNGRVSAEKGYLMNSVMIVLIEIKKKYIEANELVGTSFPIEMST
jgi:hypothetical protein